jgi:mannose/fructose/N-acetylgalactosamine-specific phosphotransferase system component IID
MLFFGQSTGVLLVAQTVDRGGLDWAYTASALGMVVLGRVIARQVRGKS